MATVTGPMTTEEFLALPVSKKIERWLVDGKLRERKMSRRSPQHASAVAQITRHLGNWCATAKKPAPKVFTGDIYFRLRTNPDTNVGIDVALASPQQAIQLLPEDQLIEGPPILAVEVLSASDRVKAYKGKARQYLKNGTAVVWIVDPFDRGVMVYRPKARPEYFNDIQTLSGDPELPGFKVTVADLFD